MSAVNPKDYIGKTLYVGHLVLSDQPDWTCYFLDSHEAVEWVRRAHRATWSRAIERAEVWAYRPTILGVMDTEQRFVSCG